MILVTASMRVPQEHVEAFVEAVRATVEATTTQEAGCRRYECGRDVLDPGQFFFTEEWEDMAAIGAHVQTQHFQDFTAATGYLTDQVITMHTVEKSRTL